MEEENKKSDTPETEEQKPTQGRRRGRKPSATSAKSETSKSTGRKPRAAQKKEEQAEEREAAKPENLAESIAYLHEIGIKKVSNKTFINETDLEAFLREDFTNINRTKALGFIQILEREYPVKLQDLRRSYMEYYREHKMNEPKAVLVQTAAEPDFEWKKYAVWTLAALLILGAVWYLFSTRAHDLSTIESEEKAIAHDINSDIVQKAEESMAAIEHAEIENGKTALPQPEKPKPLSERAVPFVKGSGSANSTLLAEAVAPAEHTESNKTVQPAAAQKREQPQNEDLDLDAMVRQMVQEYNITDIASEALPEKNETGAGRKASAIPAASETLSIKEPLKEKKVEQNKTLPEKVKSKKTDIAKESNRKKKRSSSKSVAGGKLYVVPKKKSWVGVIYLDDYTKKDFLIRRTLKLDPTRPQLIVVGHKDFEIYSDGYSYRFRGKGPVRFIYKDGNIMEINSREFKKYSKGVVW